MRRHTGYMATFGVGVLATLAIVLPLHSRLHRNKAAIQQEKYPLLAKRLFTENPNDTLINFTSVRHTLESQFDKITSPYSFYFEYIPTGTSIRISSEQQLIAASLVKLPVVMNLYHADELGYVSLSDTVQLIEDDLDPGFGDLYSKGAGYSISLRDAAKLAITQSDNTASRAINRTIAGKLKSNEESLPYLDVDYSVENGEAVVTARSYSSVLKCLYFSCYLTTDNSSQLLQYLTESPFSVTLTRYIPKDIKVAHKIGVFDPTKTYSDCGIFYVPKRPYILCILIEGDESTSDTAISDASKTIYDFITSR